MVKANFEKAKNIAQGAALMTGTTWSYCILGSAWPQIVNKTIAGVLQKNINRVGMPHWTEKEIKLAKDAQRYQKKKVVGLKTTVAKQAESRQLTFSNDVGDVTWSVPSGSLRFPSNIPNIRFHHWAAGIAPATSIAHKGEVAGAKVLALSLLDLFMNPGTVEKGKAEFKRTTQGKYFSLLPPDTKPPLGFNKAKMEKFRAKMRKFYLIKKVNFKK